MLHNEFDLVIFDCDGTLVDSEPITNRVLAEYISEFGLEMDGEEALRLFVGRDMPEIIRVLESRLGERLPDHFDEKFRERQAVALKSELEAIDGAHDLLESVSKPYCVASNAPRKKIEINLNVTKLSRFFSQDRIFSAYDIQKWKPDPDLFLNAAKRMKFRPERCVVIEDSVAGIDAGIAAGMQVIGFCHGETAPTKTVPFVSRLADLMTILG